VALLLVFVGCAAAAGERTDRHVAFIEAHSALRDRGWVRPEIRRIGAAELRAHGAPTALDGAQPVGMYLADTNVILVRRDQAEDVEIHELTHWLQHASGGAPGCTAEREAYRIQALWRQRNNMPPGHWNYPCAEELLDTLAVEIAHEIARRR
jgi:hypothetical protein